MTSGPVVVLCLQRENAVGRLLDLLGPSDPVEAKRKSQFFLRGSFGQDSVRNALYGNLLFRLLESGAFCLTMHCGFYVTA